jgi:L-ascorbate metabolism protein UlaG (beta-lactamase superfamily)
MKMTTNVLDRIKWLGHDGFEIATDALTLMIDPFQVEGDRQADIILVTHPHYDHCSVDDIARLRKPSTVIVTEPESAEKLSAANLAGDIRVVKPGDRLTVSGVPIEAVAAYNVDKHFHPKEKNWLGFIVTMDGVRVYHAGDTDMIPEMNGLRADIALLPVSGTYVMTADEAVAAAKRIKPRTAIPMHYDSIVGTASDALAFKTALAGTCDIVIPKRG